MGIIGAGLNRYYKKVDSSLTRDTSLSGVYKDIFDGNTATAKIAAAQDPQYYLSDVTIPEADSFGNSKLVGMKQYYYPTSIDIADKNYLPGMKLWKVNSHIGTDNEGTMTVNKRDLTVFTSNNDVSVPWLYDTFNNGNSKVETVRGSTSSTVYSSGAQYISLSDALTYQNRDLSRNDMIERYGDTISTKGGQETIVYVQKGRQLGNRLVSDGNIITNAIANTAAVVVTGVGYLFSWTGFAVGLTAAAATITYSEEWEPLEDKQKWDQIDIHFHNLPDSSIRNTTEVLHTGESARAIATDSDVSKTCINRLDSHGNKAIFDDSGNQMFTANGIFSPKRYISGGQSFKLTTFWDKDIVPGRNKSSEYINTRYIGLSNYKLKNRQEVKAVIEIPTIYPMIDTAGSPTMRIGDVGHSNTSIINLEGTLQANKDNSEGYTQPIISTDIYIETMSPLFRAKSDTHNLQTSIASEAMADCAWVRGMAITFSRSKPLESESFYTFMARMTSASQSADIAYGQDLRHHADKIDDAAEYGTISGVIIGKVPVEFSGSDYEAKYNSDIQNIPDYPIMAIPISRPYYDSYTVVHTLKNRWKVNNLRHSTEAGSGSRFHNDSELGNTLWYQLQVPDMPNYGVVVDEAAWLNFRFDLSESKMSYVIRDSQTGEYITNQVIPTGAKFNQENAPRYMCIWNFNFPGKAKDAGTGIDDYALNALGHTDDDGVMDFDTGTTVYVDNIAMTGFNHTHTNSTISYNNPGRGRINIASTTTTTVANDIEDSTDTLRSVPSNTYISFGFDTLAEFDKNASGNTHNLWFNGMTASSNLEAIHHDVSDMSIRAGFSSNCVKELIGGQATHSFFEYKTSPADTDSVNGKYRGLNTLGVANRGLDFDGDTQIDNFSKKGAVILDFNSQTGNVGVDSNGAQAAPAKRENLFVSAKVIDISQAQAGQITVDNQSIFNLDDDTEYVIYRANMSASSTGELIGNEFKVTGWTDSPYGTVAKLISRNGNVMTFDKDLTISGFGHAQLRDYCIADAAKDTWPLCTNKYRNILYVSPLKYWITLEVKNTSNVAGTAGLPKSYESICMVNEGRAPPTTSEFGASFSETTYTDAGTYLKGWSLIPTIDNSLIETQTDYGNGIMDVEKGPNAGFIDKIIVEEGSEDKSKWLVFDSSPIIEEDKMKSGETYTSLISGMNPLSSSSATIATDENTDKIVDEDYGISNQKRPITLAIFEDSVPTISDFSVKPNDNNPFYPEFTWKCNDDDAWYGFLIIDTEIPSHQYHKSSLHAPMWRPLPSSENPGMNWPPSSSDSESDIIDYVNNKRYPYGYTRNDTRAEDNQRPSATTAIGTHERGKINDYTTFLDPEGLSGWCHNFDGSGDSIALWAPEHSGSEDIEGSANGNQSSIVMHIRPDEYPDDEMGIFWSGGAGGIDLTMNSSGKIIARFYYSSKAFVELMSHSVAPKNGNPTNIIVTFDKDLTHGNCKLFINGKLEDQSGKVLSTGSSTRWYTNALIWNFRGGFGYLWNIGSGGGGKEFFNGKMEELVYYPHVIYPINPADGTFTWSKPVTDIDDNGKPISYFARLFVKDYHNIRGTSIKEVAMSSTLTIHKAGVEL
jgi:hypothetical protein